MTGLLGISQLAGLGKWDWPEALCAYIVRLVILLMGIEFLANFILDFYRPRTDDDVPRPSFDSRLLSLISKPGGVAKSIAEAINYQFGFEVSTTWFYKLLQRWMLPLICISCAAVLMMTSVIIVDAHEQAVIERFGEPWRGDDDRVEVLEPGVYFKLPYPIDVTRRSPVSALGEIVIGESGGADDEHEDEAIIWTEQHDFVPETMLLVATPQTVLTSGGGVEVDTVRTGSKSVPVSLIMVSLPVEYRIKDIEAYLYNYEDPVGVMRGVVEQILTEEAAGTDLDDLIGPGRAAFNQKLRDLLQKEIDRLRLGIELVFVGLRGAHPPPTEGVAAAFQGVVSAQTNAQTQINAAKRMQLQILTTVAGSLQRATALDEAIRRKDRLESDPRADSQALAEARKHLEVLLLGDEAEGVSPAGGQASTIVSDARARGSGRISAVQNMVQSFAAEVAAYEASPLLYRARKALSQWEGLDGVRKYLIVGNASNVIIEYDDVGKAGLDTVLDEAIENEKK
jgi:regulator of protease activity HflC (stomatin/prohibitin superfamily)